MRSESPVRVLTYLICTWHCVVFVLASAIPDDEAESLLLSKAEASDFLTRDSRATSSKIPDWLKFIDDQKRRCGDNDYAENGCKMHELCDAILKDCCDNPMNDFVNTYNFG